MRETMPEISQYTVKPKELTELMIKQLGVHEGQWVLLVSFAFTATNAGPEGGEMLPSALIGLQKVGIQRAEPNSPPEMIVDAAVVNPKSS